jgi:methylthioribulose-1-phosphate dehydratase
VLEGYEIVRTLDGINSHQGRVSLPIFSNYQDYRHLAIWFRRYVVRFPENSGLLIMGHGLYTWGATIADAIRQTEALEFMLECELRMAQIAPPAED